MQHRWERMLNRAETETSMAANRVRANRNVRPGPSERDRNEPAEFGQPAYGRTMPSDARAAEEQPSEKRPAAATRPEGQPERE
jgi:hypothetical protein